VRSALLLCAGALVALAGCGGAGTTSRRTVEASGFTGVATTAGIDVGVSTAAAWSVQVAASPQVINRIVVETRGSTLWIGVRPGTMARGRWLARQALVAVSLPALARLEVTDGSRALITLDQPTTDLSLELSRGSQVSGRLACAGLLLAASGSSIAQLAGRADRSTLAGSDGAKLRLTGLETPRLDAVLSGGATAAVTVTGLLTVEASGGSGLSFRGDARVELQALSGGSWLRKE